MVRSERTAVVGIGLRFPDASSPVELWENVLAGRRAFRRLPDGRTAAVLPDSELDPVEYAASGGSHRSADLTHWLALNVASGALADAGFPDGAGLRGQSTGVVLGDSLTLELSRLAVLDAHWPRVHGTVAAALAEQGLADQRIADLLLRLRVRYLAPFPPGDGDSPPSGLAGTVASAVRDYFELGMSYTVDDSCASSLLSVAIAAKALSAGELDVAIAGGIELPVDPSGAASPEPARALLTGEGAGLVVLMRERDALAQGRRIYASLAGWGVAGDGMGDDARHRERGCHQAMLRAHGRAGYGADTVLLFEGRGSGVAGTEAVELAALSAARLAADRTARPAALGSVAENIGHAGAAAGVAGLVKAVLSVYHQVIPPVTGPGDQPPVASGDQPPAQLPTRAALWPADTPVRAGVSAASAGGIHTHVAIEQAPGHQRRTGLSKRTSALVGGRQDAELLLLEAPDAGRLRDLVARLAGLVLKLSFAELADLAGALARRSPGGRYRAALVVTSPADARYKLTQLAGAVDSRSGAVIASSDGVFFASKAKPPKIAYLFPGHGCGNGEIGAIRHRFVAADAVFRVLGVPSADVPEAVQPRIVASSLAALRVLHAVGIDADIAVGHSLGELTALAWGGSMGGAQLLRLATARGEIMARASRPGGAMASLATGPGRARQLADGAGVVISGYNGPSQTVISGAQVDVDRVCVRAAADGVRVHRHDASHAFHSPLVRAVADVLTERLAELRFAPLNRPVVSSVTGDLLDPATDLRALLRDQVLLPVRFHQAAARAVAGVDLAVELGPGSVLSGLVNQIAPGTPVVSVDTGDRSLAPFLRAVGAAHALGVPVETAALFGDRLVRPLPDHIAAELADREVPAVDEAA